MESHPDAEAIGKSIEAKVEAQDVEETFSADMDDPRGLMRVLETEDYKAQIKYLRYPDSDEPFDQPWHALVSGPVARAEGWAQGKVWSNSYNDLDSAIGAATSKLRQEQRRFERRREMHQTAPRKRATSVEGKFREGEKVGYAVFDTEMGGFKSTGFYGQQAFETLEEAERVAEPGMYILSLEVERTK